jgi:predicted  nucleic acid-binding Zn-ribbon protein
MISQEYEVLLHSALEDQAIHFEGEISHLRAQLASSRMKNFNHLSDKEAREINALRNDNERLKRELNNLSSVLLESQTNESKSRALSQKLLREQSISKELLERLRKDISEERNTCRQRLDELDMEIEDLTANLRMMSQIAGSEELSQAQIVGTAGGDKDDSSTNKKKSRKLRFGKKK